MQPVQIPLDQLQARQRCTEEVAADIDTYGRGRAISNQLYELASVPATKIEHRPAGDITQKVSLRGPLDKPV
jgi:hypothetical protein